MEKENNLPQETSEVEEAKDSNWVDVVVSLFKTILGYNYFEYGGKKDF